MAAQKEAVASRQKDACDILMEVRKADYAQLLARQQGERASMTAAHAQGRSAAHVFEPTFAVVSEGTSLAAAKTGHPIARARGCQAMGHTHRPINQRRRRRQRCRRSPRADGGGDRQPARADTEDTARPYRGVHAGRAARAEREERGRALAAPDEWHCP